MSGVAPGAPSDPPPGGRPVLRQVVAGLVAAESLLLVVAAVDVVVGALTSAPADPAAAWVLAGIVLVVAAGLAVAARGLAGGRRRARIPVLVWQVLQAAGAMSAALPGGALLRGALLGVSAAVVLGVLRNGIAPGAPDLPG